MGMVSGFFDVSLDHANQFYAWGWRASLLGAIITGVGIGSLWLGTRVRDRNADENIARLHESTARSEERSKELEKGNLELATVLEKERQARARLEAGLASRHVRPEQAQALASSLRGISLDVTLSRYADPETARYADEISAALIAAGVNVIRGSNIMMSGSQASGVFIEEAADMSLVNALFMAGVATGKMPSTKNSAFHTGQGLNAMLVGIKPNPF